MDEDEYCCKGMREADKEEVIDYCEPNLTTIDAKGLAFPISYCPFCCKKLEGSIASMERITNAAKEYSTKFIPKSPTEHQRGGQVWPDCRPMDSKESDRKLAAELASDYMHCKNNIGVEKTILKAITSTHNSFHELVQGRIDELEGICKKCIWDYDDTCDCKVPTRKEELTKILASLDNNKGDK